MHNGSYPTEITVVVYSVKNIKPKKKDPKYCVIFSVGPEKYRTDPVQDVDGNPLFNTTSTLQVENPKFPLILVVTEKKEKEFYGELVIPLDELESSRNGQIHKKFLAPHKKCSKPSAEIHFEVWVSKRLSSSSIIVSDIQVPSDHFKKKPLSGLKKTLVGLVGSPKLLRKKSGSKVEKGSEWFDSPMGSFAPSRGFSSCMDLSGNTGTLPIANSTATLSTCKEVEDDINEEKSKAPYISGISPNSGPVNGGTKITIRGENLGRSREDVVGLFFCGSNVLASLEYFSSCKVLCTTKPWKSGEGVIAMETQSGGKSSSTIRFTFVPDGVDPLNSDPLRRSESLKDTLKQMDNKTSTFGTPQPMRAAFGKKPLPDKGFLGLPTLSASKSMSNLAAQGHTRKDADGSGKTTPSNTLFVPSTNHKNGQNHKQPPIIQIHPMRFQDLAPKISKLSNKHSTAGDYIHFKDLQMQLDDYQMINTELRMKADELEGENRRLKEYIENLVIKIMVKCPEMLCNNKLQ